MIRIAMAITIGVAALAVSARPAQAGGSGDPIVGDFDGDGVADTAVPTMAVGTVVRCQLQVWSGGTGSPTTRTYLTLPADQPYCPDLGTAGEIDSSGRAQIVLAWFAGRPPAVGYDLLTLRNFRLVATSEAMAQPSYLGHADFDADGWQDVYERTDQGEGYATYLSNGDGTFTPGPEKYCAQPRRLALRDFDHDGAQDALISYIENCADFSSGVVVVLDDGTVRQLQRDPDGLTTWTAQVVHVNDDGRPDVRTVNQQTGVQQYFVNTGNGGLVPPPKAVADHATVYGSQRTTIPVLANDLVSRTATVSVLRQPTYGRVQVSSAGTVSYLPYRQHGRGDSFTYRVTDQGRTSTAGVGITFVP